MKYYILLFAITVFFMTATAQEAYLDSTFNGTGIFRANHTGGVDIPLIMLTRPNGKSLEIGQSSFGIRNPVDPWNPKILKVAVVQFDINGLPDASFGDHGVVLLDIQISGGAFLQPDGKLLITGYDSVLRLKEDGSMDTDFGINGIATYESGQYWGNFNVITLQPDGKILLGGYGGLVNDPPNSNKNFLLIRLDIYGAVDLSFGINGITYSDILTEDNRIEAIAVGEGGAIIATGSIGQFSNSRTMVARYLENGTSDSSFGQNGIVLLANNPIVGEGGASKVVVQTDGKIIIAGPNKYSYSNLGFVERLTSDGALDNTFESMVTIGTVTGMLEWTDGSILVSSFRNQSSFYSDSSELNIMRYEPSGLLDLWKTNYFPINIYRMNAGLGIQSDGKIIVGGIKGDAFQSPDYCLMRFSTDVLPEKDYGIEGFAIRNVGSNFSTAYSVLITSQNRVWVGGEAGDDSPGFVTRLSVTGTLDSFFSDDGWSAPSLPIITEKQDGKILAAGGTYKTVLLRQLLQDGSVDTSFGFDQQGISFVYIDRERDVRVCTISQLSDGKILVLGGIHDLDISSGNVVVVRFTSNGQVDSSFALDGVLLTAPLIGAYEVNTGAVLPDNKILVAGNYYEYSGATPKTFLIRYLPDGGLDPTFGTNGTVIGPFSASLVFQTKALALQSDGRIVLCGSTGNGSSKNSAVGRLNANGIKDNTFSGDGVVWISTGPFMETANALAVQNDGKIVVAASYDNSNDINESDLVLIRLKVNGTLDSTFSENGHTVTELPGDNEPNALVITPDGHYVVAGFSEDDYLVIKYLSALKVDLVNTPVDPKTLLVYPNPVHGTVMLEYSLPVSGEVTLEMFDLNGKLIHTFFQKEQKPQGENTAIMHIPTSVVAGAYVLRLQTGLGSIGIRIMVE